MEVTSCELGWKKISIQNFYLPARLTLLNKSIIFASLIKIYSNNLFASKKRHKHNKHIKKEILTLDIWNNVENWYSVY